MPQSLWAMMITPVSTADPHYHARHRSRSRRRAECISRYIERPSSVLDVGCNEGITSRYLLETGKAYNVTGIELARGTVSPSLLTDPRFTFLEGDITAIEVPDRYDVCIYGAVHHHVLGQFGLGVAVSVLQKLAAKCERTLFLESGHLSEGGRWGWQREMHQYFRSDEEHLHYLLSTIEQLVKKFQIIGRYWIHGVRRWYLKIDLHPFEQRRLGGICPVDSMPQASTSSFGRTFGSRHQQLVRNASVAAAESPTMFWLAVDKHGKQVFLKRHVHRPAAAIKEYIIGQQVKHEWAVRPLGASDEFGALVFPYVSESTNLATAGLEADEYRETVTKLLLKIFEDAKRTMITMDEKLLLPLAAPKSLLDVCDLNYNNILITKSNDGIALRVIDFEQQGSSYRWRNRLNLAVSLLRLRRRMVRAVLEYALGVLGLLRHLVISQFRRPEQRIRDRQPALLSVVVTELRSHTGRLTGQLLQLSGRDV
jgi:SAM-dependent methyltransferase